MVVRGGLYLVYVNLCVGSFNTHTHTGWEKQSYGYHADDGCVFSSSGTGQTYGPTFTTGDTVGCGLNLVERSIFYTKNGMNIGQEWNTVHQH